VTSAHGAVSRDDEPEDRLFTNDITSVNKTNTSASSPLQFNQAFGGVVLLSFRNSPMVALSLAPLVVFSIGCSKKSNTGAKTPTHVAAAPTPAATPAAPPESRVGVSDDLIKQCRLHFASTDRAPKFAYNDEELLPADRDILQQVANCLTSGPLKGKAVQLVGRSDPRGTDEYNLGLGTRRAQSVSTYLIRLGVPNTQLATTTRGEIDANGTDESSWQSDRRVDLELRP
jgi:peptidoglycan-associated lipoprotein